MNISSQKCPSLHLYDLQLTYLHSQFCPHIRNISKVPEKYTMLSSNEQVFRELSAALSKLSHSSKEKKKEHRRYVGEQY